MMAASGLMEQSRGGIKSRGPFPRNKVVGEENRGGIKSWHLSPELNRELQGRADKFGQLFSLYCAKARASCEE